MIQSTDGAASSLLLTGRAGWLGLHVKPPPFTGRWEDQEATYVVLDLEGAEYNVDLPEKVRVLCHRTVVRLLPGMSRRRSSASWKRWSSSL
jgi:hypothetical protein